MLNNAGNTALRCASPGHPDVHARLRRAGALELAVGTTGSDGTLRTSLPAGAWTMSVQSRTALSAWPSTGNLVPGGSAADVVSQISSVS